MLKTNPIITALANTKSESTIIFCRNDFAKFLCVILLIFYFQSAHSQTADFSFTAPGNAFCTPAIVQFTQTASGTPIGYIWDLGNGANSNVANPSTTYTATGSYVVKLTVIYDDAAISVSKTVVINPAAVLTIVPDRNYICRPGQINFNTTGNFSSGSYAWNFGDGITTTTTSPSIVHSYAALGNFGVSLVATDANGCIAQPVTQISVMQPPITASVSPLSGCIPATTNFSASVNVPVGGSVTNYAWTFGDGTTASTATANTNHTYASTGGYNSSLIITTNEGCTNSYNFPGIAFGTPPSNPVAYLKKDTICGSETLVMVAKAGNANNYAWNFGDGTAANTSDTFITHKFISLGNKNITVTPTFNGCAGATLTLNAFVKGVIADFTSVNTCSSRNTFTFTNTSLGNVSTNTWNFGDGAVANNIATVSHAYPAPGQYPANFVVRDSVAGCIDTFKQTIYYASPVMVSNDTLVCKGSPVTLSINDNYANPTATYFWYVAGDPYGPIPEATLNGYITNNHGLFYNYVVIDNGVGYCTDTIRQAKPVRVRGLQMNFTTVDSTCLNNTLSINNTSAPYYPADTARLYYWNFGDKPANDTIYQPAPHKYSGAGNYTVAVFGVDKNGCRDSLKKIITINPLPFVRSIPAIDTLCAGQFKTLISFHSDSIIWSPAAQVGCTSCDTISVSPPVTTSFVATAINSFGCSSADTSIVKVFAPFTATTSFTDTAICLNDTIRLMALPAGKKVLWLPSTYLSSVAVYNPLATPLQSIQYRVALTDSVGCFSDTADLNITIKSLPIVDAGPSATYSYNSLFNFQPTYSTNVNSYTWTPPTLLNCTNCPIPTGRNEYSQTYTVKVTSDSGCIAKDTVTILIDCKDAYLLMPTAFSPDNNGLNDYYFPLTRGVGTIKNFMIYNRVGQLVYQAKNFSPNDQRFGWDGRFKSEPQPNGAYVFIMEALCDAGQTLTRKGSFILLR